MGRDPKEEQELTRGAKSLLWPGFTFKIAQCELESVMRKDVWPTIFNLQAACCLKEEDIEWMGLSNDISFKEVTMHIDCACSTKYNKKRIYKILKF